jgi:hypothetical protein
MHAVAFGSIGKLPNLDLANAYITIAGKGGKQVLSVDPC